MTIFRKLWTALIDTLKPQMLREPNVGLHSIFVDTRPFNTKGR